ncbi:MAG: TIGR03032 family protein [Proteobacteria bacterium]|nr:TIGR03032 family protein [Pseudomonadota bacterium]
MTQNNKLEFNASRQFCSWLKEHKISLSFSTYQAGKLFFIGLDETQKLSVFERTFARCMGIGLDPKTQSLWVANLYQIWRFENALKPGQDYQGYDRVYVPQVGFTTGDVDAHDIAVGDDGAIFVNTLFSCLAKTSEKYSFEPIWRPPHVSKLAAEDRCHLNGLAMKDGKPGYVTCVSKTDVNEGWREHRQTGGVVIDVQSNEYVAEGLSMPHSPRWYKDKLWLLNSGEGEFGYVDLTTGKFEAMAFCPGYLRGMSFFDDFAIVGLSKPRENKTFNDLALQQKLEDKQVQPRCALQVINLTTGDVVHELRIEGVVEELYDVCVLPDVVKPMAIGFINEEIRRVLSLPS